MARPTPAPSNPPTVPPKPPGPLNPPRPAGPRTPLRSRPRAGTSLLAGMADCCCAWAGVLVGFARLITGRPL